MEKLAFAEMTDDDVLFNLRKYSIGLTVDEARKVQEMLGRAPTVVEAVIWGIQGSEHCSYKSSRRFLREFPTTGRHVILGPGEDSGIVAVTDGPPGKRWGIVISHESHNHPSQIVPFEGAATGVGGTVRDVACMGARVIGCMDMLRLGDLKNPEARSIAREVIRGIAGYGNPLGVPNLGGDTVFDPAFDSNCLVNAVAIGIVREDEILHSFVPEEAAREGYEILLVGKPTDRSGFGGAAFASLSMEEDKKEQNTGAVQEPNPFLERHILLSTYALFDWLVATGNLSRVSFKDLGAGGVVCSSVEQVAMRGFGAEVDLDKVHVSLPDLPPEVISCAETQERFCWIVHPSLTARILKHYNEDWDLPGVSENARASVIGKVTADGVYRLHHKGRIVCEARSEDITSGLKYERSTAHPDVPHAEPSVTCDGDTIAADGFRTTLQDVFTAMLSHPNHASKWPVVRTYDRSVIGNTIIEPGEADASVITPFHDLPSYVPGGRHPGWDDDPALAKVGVAFAAGGSARYGRVSAYFQGVNAVAEAVCNVVAVGAVPRALTDCLNYGNPEVPSQLGALEQGVRGIADAARGLALEGDSIPVISGNVSLYNGRPDGSAIPPSAIVCCVGALRDASTAMTAAFKAVGSALYLLGDRKDECGGSAYYEVLESMAGRPRDAFLGSQIPSPDFAALSRDIRCVLAASDARLLRGCHDLSDGGVLLALFEMTVPQRRVGGSIGARIDLRGWASGLRPDVALFSQTPGFLVEIDPTCEAEFLTVAAAAGSAPRKIGYTVADAMFTVVDASTTLLSEPLPRLRELWSSGLVHAWEA